MGITIRLCGHFAEEGRDTGKFVFAEVCSIQHACFFSQTDPGIAKGHVVMWKNNIINDEKLQSVIIGLLQHNERTNCLDIVNGQTSG